MNILILKSYSIGNILMMTPMLRALGKAGHDISILYDDGPLGGFAEELIGGLPYIKEMKAFDSTSVVNGDAHIRWVTDRNFDLCIQSFPADGLWDWLFQYIKCEIRKAPRPIEFDKHEVEYNLEMVKDLIEEDASLLYDIVPPTVSQERIDKINKLIGAKKYVALCPCFKKEGLWQKKNWGIENYAELINMLDEKGYKAVLVDGADGIGVCNVIKHLSPRCVNLAGLTTIDETKFILKNAFVVIANDCGPAHMAAALGSTTMTLFGPTSVICKQPLGSDVIILKTGISDDPSHKHGISRHWGGCTCLTALKPVQAMRAFINLVVKQKSCGGVLNG